MKNSIKILLGLTLAVIGFQAQALTVSGDCNNTVDGYGNTCYWADPNDPSQPSVSEIEALVGVTGLFELYKINYDGLVEESLPFIDSYTTTFTGEPGVDGDPDPAGGSIVYDSPNPSISCPECFLLVKDGAGSPSWFVFDLGNWNGTDTIIMEDFWLGTGSISNVVIYGNISNVPEPGMVGLLAIGLIGVVVARRKMKV